MSGPGLPEPRRSGTRPAQCLPGSAHVQLLWLRGFSPPMSYGRISASPFRPKAGPAAWRSLPGAAALPVLRSRDLTLPGHRGCRGPPTSVLAGERAAGPTRAFLLCPRLAPPAAAHVEPSLRLGSATDLLCDSG